MKIAFICTGNACRSQMAEGWGKYYAQGKHEIYSAGTQPFGVHPKAIAAMQELGIDISDHTSDHISTLPLDDLDYFITLCDSAAQSCPLPPEKVKHLHWSTPDPFLGDQDYFNEIRDQLGEKIKDFLNSLE